MRGRRSHRGGVAVNKQRFRESFDMAGRVLVVTGGTRVIGRALAANSSS